MRDFHLANQIVKLIENCCQKHRLRRVKKIDLELGDVWEYRESANAKILANNIQLLMPDTEVNIRTIKGDYWQLTNIEGD